MYAVNMKCTIPICMQSLLMLGRACWVWAGLAWAAAALLKAVATEYSECTLNSSYTFYRVCVCRDSNIFSYNFALPCTVVCKKVHKIDLYGVKWP